MAVKLGNGNWAVKEDKLLAYNDNSGRFFNKEFDFARGSSATYVGKDGLIKSAASDVPRIDFSDSTNGALLLEPQSTNLIPYSEALTSGDWGVSVGTTPTLESGYLAPDGTNNAFKISNANQDSAWLYPFVVLGTSSRSIYARTVSGTGTAQLLSHNSNTNNTFNITEQWQRFDVDTANSTGSTFFYAVDFRGSGTLNEIILWGANATNDQNFATSYIPTSGSATTRLADVCNNSGSAQDFNSEEGVLYAEIAALANDGTSRRISLSDGSIDNRVSLEIDETANKIKAFISSGGVHQVLEHTATDLTQNNKIAIKYKLNDTSIWLNGSEVVTDTSVNMPIGLDRLNFDSGGFNSAKFFGKTKDLQVLSHLKFHYL